MYIVEVQRTSEQLFLRLRNSNSQMASTIVVDREGVVCEKLHALQGQLESRNCYEGDDASRVQCFWSQLAMLPFSSLPLGSCEFFF